MPIIASHHLKGDIFSKKSDYQPLDMWPEDCTVQWGGSGIVLSENGGRKTAFFEAFPKGPGFFRGEGQTISEAEEDCFEKWKRFSKCDHIWGRGFKVETRSTKKKHGIDRPKLRGRTAYTNGGAICKKCKAFASMFHEVHTLGSWRGLPDIHTLTMAADGYLRPSAYTAPTKSSIKHRRRSELILRLAGIDLPETPIEPEKESSIFGPPDDYILACRKAVVDWYIPMMGQLAKNESCTMGGFFSVLDHKMLTSLVEQELRHRDEHLQESSGVDL
jgi:hypothetical protein